MTVRKALAIVIVGVIVFAVIGGLTGAVIGNVSPGYYRAVFRQGRHPDFNPLEVGIGLGVTQGMGAGLAISLAVVALLAWKEHRTVPHISDPLVDDSRPREGRSWALIVSWGVLTLSVVVICSAVAFVGGLVVGESGQTRRTAEQKMDKIQTLLDSDGYAQLKCDFWSDGQVYLTGEVPTGEAHTALQQKLQLAFGTADAAEMIRHVRVRP